MMLWFTEYLADHVSGFAVFQYLTFRTVVSTMTALPVTSAVMKAASGRRSCWPKNRSPRSES